MGHRRKVTEWAPVLEISQRSYTDLQKVVETLTAQLEHLRGPQQLSA